MPLDPAAFVETADVGAAVLDYVGGRADLAAGVVRAIGEPRRRFKEDKLRMLRAVRFAARLSLHRWARWRRFEDGGGDWAVSCERIVMSDVI